ncbi:hypothetical protein ABZW18_18875 [Streptomyces sp. NPDC004647]|uniref:hypothetical protein n=1 Tax=Streptomyces sp. NPDC004647 TaxID=3154671 RepID=UPI0033AE9B46
MTVLYIAFEPELPGLHGSDQVFTSVENDGWYPLPDVVLETRGGIPRAFPQELRITETGGGPPALRQWLENNWAPREPLPGTNPLYARSVVLSGLWVPAEVVRAPDGRPGEVRTIVSWRLTYKDEQGTPDQDFATVHLVFATERTRRADTPLTGIPRHIGDQAIFRDFAAIDFGTTSSTATIYNGDENTVRRMDPEQQRQLALGLAKILQPHHDLASSVGPEAGSPDDAVPPPGWADEADHIAAGVLQAEPDNSRTVRRLCELLRAPGNPGPLPVLVERTAYALEGRGRTSAWSNWVVPRLHTAYVQALRVPPLSQLGLQRVDFGGATITYEAPSALNVREGVLHLSAQHSGTVRGLKRLLRHPADVPVPVLGEGVVHPSDDLIALTFVRLIESAEALIRNPQTGEPRRLTELVATSPTTTAPGVRARMVELLRTKAGLSQVVTDYDEGVSAGLFFVMRDFSGDPGAGVEVMRAAARRLHHLPRPTWLQTMLVIDVGGGTTDIALLGLTLTDLSEEMSAQDKRTRGRTYELRPEVLGSTGHPDLGGDYLTLRVYYLLKASLIDRLMERAYTATQTGKADGDTPHTTPGSGRGRGRHRELLELAPPGLASASGAGPGSLAAEVLTHLAPPELPKTLAPEAVRRTLMAVLPTGWERTGDQENPLFHALWENAEKAKVHLGQPGNKTWPVSTNDVSKWLEQLGQGGGDDEAADEDTAAYLGELLSAQSGDEFLALRQEDFQRLAAPVFREAAAIAVDMVQSRFRQDPDLTLDRIMLCGRSTSMPIAKEAVAAEIAPQLLTNGSPVFRNPAAIDVEAPFAKQATSLGAAWVHARSRPVLRAGGDDLGGTTRTTSVTITTGDLSPTLPCDFRLIGPENKPVQIFTVGEPYEEVPGDRMAVRTGWGTAERMVNLHRPLNGKVSMSWGSFGVERAAAVQGVQLESDLWWGRIADGVTSQVRMQLEVDERLEPRIHFCVGSRPHLVVDGRSVDLVRSGHAVLDADGHLTSLTASLVLYGVNRRGERTERRTVIDRQAWRETGRDTGPLTQLFHDSRDLDSPGDPLPGMVVAIDPLPTSDEYVFEALMPEGDHQEIDRLRVPPGTRKGARHYLTLDSHGMLRVNRHRLPYWEAKDLRAMQENPGSVYTSLMQQDLDSLFPDWAPFNGRH